MNEWTSQNPHPVHPIVVADDQELFRGAIATLIDAQPDLRVTGQAHNGLEAVELVRELTPELVLLDVSMPVMGGVEAARLIRQSDAHVKTLMLSVEDEQDTLLDSLRGGADGYLLKDLRPEELFQMIRAALRVLTPVAPSLVPLLVAEVRAAARATQPAPGPETTPLSYREIEILQHVAQGLSNKEIGRLLSITDGTVKNHVHNALHKLNMENRTQAAAYVVRQGLGAPATGRHSSH